MDLLPRPIPLVDLVSDMETVCAEVSKSLQQIFTHQFLRPTLAISDPIRRLSKDDLSPTPGKATSAELNTVLQMCLYLWPRVNPATALDVKIVAQWIARTLEAFSKLEVDGDHKILCDLAGQKAKAFRRLIQEMTEAQDRRAYGGH